MTSTKLLALILFITTGLFGQVSIDKPLKKSLDSLYVLDQKFRAFMDIKNEWRQKRISKKYNLKGASFEDGLWKIQNRIDSSNLVFIENVFKTKGYPGIKLVGHRTNKVAWFVIQHSNKIPQYLDLMKQASKEGQLSQGNVAMMEDRYLMFQGQEQIYGTQGYCPPSWNTKDECIIWPIRDAENVNKLRKDFGFKETIEEYAKRLNIKYRIVKLDEIQNAKKDAPTGSNSR